MRQIITSIIFLLFCVKIYSGELSAYTQSLLNSNKKVLLKNYNIPEKPQSCYLHFSNHKALYKAEELGVKINNIIGNIATVSIPLSAVNCVAEIEGVERIESAAPVYQTLDNIRIDNSINNVNSGIGLPSPYTGKGVIVGIIDQGIQFDHINFYDADGNLRIKRVWIQTDTSGNKPQGFDYGSEYITQKDIEEKKYDDDNATHGVHVTGIAAGGYKGCEYYGVATEADIVFVSYDGNTSNISDAISYIYNYANEVGKPAVINMSIGSFIGPRDGTSDFDLIADELQGEGQILVGAAGNGGNSNIHTSKTLSSYSDTFKTYMPCSYKLYNYGTQNIDYIEIYGNSNTNLNISLALYNKTTKSYVSQSATVYSRFGTSTSFTLNEGIIGTIDIYSETLATSRRPHILIVKSLTQSSENYAVEINITSSKNNTIHAWSYLDTFEDLGESSHCSGNNDYSIFEVGGTGKRIITVGSYVNKSAFGGVVGSISSISSRGPTLDGRQKPDITAPGEGVVSSYSNSPNIAQSSYYKPYLDYGTKISLDGETYYYGVMSGTSMSAPVVTGIIATWLQARPTLSPEEIKEIIKKSARTDEYTGDISENGNIWGYGKIDAWAGLKECLVMNSIDDTETLSEDKIIFRHNPYTNNIALLFTADIKDIDICVYDITGKAVQLKRVSNITSGDEIELKIDNYPKGVYIIKAFSNDINKTFKTILK